MPSFLVESHLAQSRAAELATTASRARQAAEAMRGEGIPVHHVRSTFLAEEEVCVHVFEASSAAVAGEASRRAAITYDRIMEATE